MGYAMLIFTIICAVVCYAAVSWGLWKKFGQAGPYNATYEILFITHIVAAWALWGLLFVGFPIGMAGLDPDYGGGEVDGYLYVVERSGVVWKTYEVSILVGKTEADSLQWRLSTPDKSIGKELMRLRGKKVRILYREWAKHPWHVGEKDTEIMSVEEED